jgi:two-component system, NtrC family, nitrogen regulation sensor histidine kinase GlnL
VQAENVYPLIDHARRVALAGFAAGVAIDERFDPSLPPALANRDAVLQVLLNLIKNACEATAGQPERRVTLATAYRHGVAASAAPGQPRRPLPIEVAVLDNGPGAPADIAHQLFDPFVSGRPEGQGLGLALVDKLVRDMGGIVQYAREGTPAVTAFRVLLPRAAA